MPNLYMVMLGGRHAKANTEVHDVVFVVGDTLQDCYPQLRETWFGDQNGLHIDAWMQVDVAQADDQYYQIGLSTQPSSTALKLWLINLGGYDAQEFGELHRYILIVAENEHDAKQRGKQHFAQHWQKQHTDRVLEIDDCFYIEQIQDVYVQLSECSMHSNINHWENCYTIL